MAVKQPKKVKYVVIPIRKMHSYIYGDDKKLSLVWLAEEIKLYWKEITFDGFINSFKLWLHVNEPQSLNLFAKLTTIMHFFTK